jgi:hypothetical protein
MRSRDVLMEAFGRLPALVSSAVDGLSATQLIWAPAAGANTVGWLVWHLTRIQDDHVADLLDAPQIWDTGEWASHFGLAPDPSDTGYGHDAAQVAAVQPDSDMSLTGYYAEVWDRRSELGSAGDARRTPGQHRERLHAARRPGRVRAWVDPDLAVLPWRPGWLPAGLGPDVAS